MSYYRVYIATDSSVDNIYLKDLLWEANTINPSSSRETIDRCDAFVLVSDAVALGPSPEHLIAFGYALLSGKQCIVVGNTEIGEYARCGRSNLHHSANWPAATRLLRRLRAEKLAIIQQRIDSLSYCFIGS